MDYPKKANFKIRHYFEKLQIILTVGVQMIDWSSNDLA